MKEKIVTAAKSLPTYQQEALTDYCALPAHLYQPHTGNGRVPAPGSGCDFSKPTLWSTTPNGTVPSAVSLGNKRPTDLCVITTHNSHNHSNHVYSTIGKNLEFIDDTGYYRYTFFFITHIIIIFL